MKKFIIIATLSLMTVALSACGGTAIGDESIAKKYGLTIEQYQEIKKAAEGMGMSVESHLGSMGFEVKQ